MFCKDAGIYVKFEEKYVQTILLENWQNCSYTNYFTAS